MKDIKPQPGSIQENEILLREDDLWLHFADPDQLISAERLDEVLPALQRIERLVQLHGWHAAGFISYEAASAFDAALHTRSSVAPESSRRPAFPFLWFGLYPPPRLFTLPSPTATTWARSWIPTVGQTSYAASIDQIKKYIAEGRTYQVNYTMRLEADFAGDPWDFFLHIAQTQNNQAAYIDTGQYVICSASPELFFRLEGNTITCRPMKGTTRRGRTTAEDCEQSEWLKHSAKNRAENVMIVDMVRNDLGRIAETGTVEVPELFRTERYPTLWQMTSTITARTTASVAQILTALFPSASITGAPKVSTMAIIADLETTPRGIYTGSIGYIAPERQAKFNVAIRTAVIDRITRTAEYGVGGGIVWDSTSQDEYAEALLKARVLMEPSPSFSLIETMLWTPEEGFFLFEKHLSRLLDSANYFDIPVTRNKLQSYLGMISLRLAEVHVPQRVRILADPAGRLDFETRPLDAIDSSDVLPVCLATQPVDSNDVFLYHKTTQRSVYERAREECDDYADVLLYNERGELTEFTIGNLVVELEGQQVTPPILCGVLPGTYRAHLLETGQIVERTVRVDQLPDCTQIFRVNSVRKWQEVDLQAERKKV